MDKEIITKVVALSKNMNVDEQKAFIKGYLECYMEEYSLANEEKLKVMEYLSNSNGKEIFCEIWIHNQGRTVKSNCYLMSDGSVYKKEETGFIPLDKKQSIHLLKQNVSCSMCDRSMKCADELQKNGNIIIL